jgi:hypothetical protein
MKNTIIQENNWKIHKLIDIGTSSERWHPLEQVVFEESVIDGLGDNRAVKSLNLCLEAMHKKYPNIVLGIEIQTINNNQIVKYDYAKKLLM